jgi:hypothetical protein
LVAAGAAALDSSQSSTDAEYLTAAGEVVEEAEEEAVVEAELVEEGQELDSQAESAGAAGEEEADEGGETESIAVQVASMDEFLTMATELAHEASFSVRDSRVRSLREVPWDITLSVERIERNMGIGLDRIYRNGRRIISTVEGSAVQVVVALPAAQNEQIDALGRDETFRVTARIHEYRAVLKRFEMLAE